MSSPLPEEEQQQQEQQLPVNEPPVGGQRVPITAEDEKPVDTTNAISTDKEELQERQHSQEQDLSRSNPQTETPNNNLNTPVELQQTEQYQMSAPTSTTNQQQPISATTSAGITAPKPKADFTTTDATIQGLLVQIIALQHNKIQQLSNQEE